MTLSLREKRRLETARDIQLATLKLAVRHGLEKITAEEIAADAGVSTRTFFNYYTNKEAAAVGTPPAFSEENKAELIKGTNALADDMKAFLDRHMEILARDEPILKMVGTVVRTNEKARGILESFLNKERNDLAECLTPRLNNPHTAAALASITTDTIARAIFLWEHAQDLSLASALDSAWEGLMEASRLLASPSQ